MDDTSVCSCNVIPVPTPHFRGQGIQQNHSLELLVSAILDSKMAAILNVIACKLGSKADRNAIPTATPHFRGQLMQ